MRRSSDEAFKVVFLDKKGQRTGDVKLATASPSTVVSVVDVDGRGPGDLVAQTINGVEILIKR